MSSWMLPSSVRLSISSRSKSAALLLIRVTQGSRTSDSSVLVVQHLHELPERGGAEDHPLVVAEQVKAVFEQLGALLAPVAAPVARGAVGAVAIEAGKDVEGVGSGHDALLECAVDRVCGYRLETTAKLIAVGILESSRIG